MPQILLIGCAGLCGVLARYGVILLCGQYFFPLATLLVNISGSFLAGVVANMVPAGLIGSSERQWLMVGFLGAYTTMSAFAFETISLWQSGRHSVALINVIANIGACLCAVVAGKYAVLLYRTLL